jgi:glycosyltransferase involved in cell wall biosynthesis
VTPVAAAPAVEPARGLHLIIQIPCFNEAATLPAVVADLPRQLPGIAVIEYLVIDDGSQDGTAEIARRLGVHHIVQHQINRGIAAAFQSGLDACLKAGADIIVNTDGDHQYPGGEIERLIAPILAGQADLVVGDRQTRAVEHFSPVKRRLQQLGSWVVRAASGTSVPDATSGFRALSREAALRLIVLTRFSYTLDTLIQAGKKGLRVCHVPIQVNAPTRESRLFRSNWSYIKRQTATIVRIYALYEPLRTFFLLALPFLLAGSFLIARFLWFYITGQTDMGRHVQSVVIGGTLLTLGFLIFLFGVLADLTAMNRQLVEETLYRQRKQEVDAARLAAAGRVDLPRSPADSARFSPVEKE